MTPDMMVVTDLDGRKLAGDRDAVVRAEDAPAGVSRSAGCAGRRPRASAHRDRLCRRRDSARSRGARRGRDDARQHSDCGVRDAVDRRAAGGVQQVSEGARRPAARQSRRAGDRARSVHRVSPDGDDRALREDQPGDAARWAARTCCRARKCSGCRGCAGCTASRRRRRSAPTTTRSSVPAARWNARWCRRRSLPRARVWSPTCPAGAPRPTVSAVRRAAGRRRGNSANIPRTDGTDRRRRPESEVNAGAEGADRLRPQMVQL